MDFVAGAVVGFLFLTLFHLSNRYHGKIVKAFRATGKYSLYILCFHTIEYLVFPWERVSAHFTGHVIAGTLVTFAIRSIMIAVGCYLIKIYLNKKMKKNRVK